MPDDKLQNYINNNKLNYLVIQIIKHQFGERNRVKRYSCGFTHNLKEISGNDVSENFFKNNEEIEQNYYEPIVIERIKTEIINGLEIGDYDTEVFVMAQIEYVTSISRRTGIARHKLHESINRVKLKLKKL